MIPEHINSLHNQSRLLYSMSEVGTAVSRMAAEITQKLSTSCPWVMPVMNGGLIPAGLLLQQLDFPLQLDYLHATRYGQGTSGGKLVWKVFPGEHLAGQTVLLIDDILDKGQTLANVVEACRQQGAVAVYSAVLVEKHCQRGVDIQADFIGLSVPDVYVYGCGMDYQGYLRNVNGIYALNSL